MYQMPAENSMDNLIIQFQVSVHIGGGAYEGSDDVKPTDFFTMSSTGLRGHELMLYKLQAHLDIRKNVFTVRVIDEWNRLPESLLHCGTLSTFKKRLDCYLKNRGYD